MIREHVFRIDEGGEPWFRWRGGEVSRIEALADMVFAFGITLLVVSLEVPASFDELFRMMEDFAAFALCFALMLFIWHSHYKFFRRYGLEDTYTVLLNAILLFVVLFYLYPLKFLFTFLVGELLGLGGPAVPLRPDWSDMSRLMIIYDTGFLAVFLCFTLLYAHAYRRRGALGLDELERHTTVTALQGNAIMCAVALTSMAIIALRLPQSPLWAGLVYWIIAPALGVHGYLRGRGHNRLVAARTALATAGAGAPAAAGGALDVPDRRGR